MRQWEKRRAMVDSPFGATKAEAVGQLAPQRVPVLCLLFLRQLQKRVVITLQLLILLGHGGVVLPLGASLAGTAAASAAAASTSASASTFALSYVSE